MLRRWQAGCRGSSELATGIKWPVMVVATAARSRVEGKKHYPVFFCQNQGGMENKRPVLCSGTGRQSYVWGGERRRGDAISAWHAAGDDQYVC